MAAIAPHIGRCECGERDHPEDERDEHEMLVWVPVDNGVRYARCYGCGAIHRVKRTYENHQSGAERHVGVESD